MFSDTLFLLRFLRAAKFSQLKARTRLENYLKSLQEYSKWTTNLDPSEPGMQELMKSGSV